jgi:hypothetical protein
MGGVSREVALRLGVATKARRWLSRRWPATSNAGSPKQERKRGGTRGRRQRRGGRAVEDPQATRGLHSGWRWNLGRGAGDGRWWQNGSRGEARVTEEEEGRQGSEGPVCNFPKSSGIPL